jgi:tRNA(Arg) A34 adenosine deaminase TadA
MPTPEGFMRLAQAFRVEAIAAGDQAYGAVLVLGGEAVGEGVSAVVTTNDPTAHAEMRAIRDACRRLDRRSLAGAVLYSTSRPCPMCEAAATWAGVERMVHGAALVDAGRPRLPGSPAC